MKNTNETNELKEFELLVKDYDADIFKEYQGFTCEVEYFFYFLEEKLRKLSKKNQMEAFLMLKSTNAYQLKNKLEL